MQLLPDQLLALEWACDPNPTARMLAWRGGAGVGKTFGCALCVLTVLSQYRGKAAIVLGQSRATLHKTVVPKIKQLCEMAGTYFHPRWDRLEVGHNEIHLYGASRQVSDPQFEGTDALCVWADETTLLQRDLVERATGRFRGDPPLIFLSFNVGRRSHWLREWLDPDPDKGIPHVYLRSDRETAKEYGILSEEADALQQRTLSGHRRKWLIEDEWSDPAGLCLPSLVATECTGPPYYRVAAGVDWGTTHPTAAEFIGLTSTGWEHCQRPNGEKAEYYWNPANEEAGKRSAGQHAAEILQIGRELGCNEYVVDTAAEEMSLALDTRGAYVIDARRDVEGMIDRQQEGYHVGAIRACECHSPELVRTAGGYVWDERATKPKPIKRDDDPCDADRYVYDHVAAPTTAYATSKPPGL